MHLAITLILFACGLAVTGNAIGAHLDHCDAYLAASRSNNSTDFAGSLKNDNFCDCATHQGILEHEESSSSACSFFTPGKGSFRCAKDVRNEARVLFASRVNDGVCDCCDASDEDPLKNGGVVCQDTCETDLMAARRSALLWHRTVQAGKHKRQEQINELERKRHKESEIFSNIEGQLKDLKAVQAKMSYYLWEHSPREDMERFRLLRERLMNCVYGELDRCNLFHPEFFDNSELPDYEQPESVRKNIKPRPKCLHSDAEWSLMNSHTGTDRVRQTLCNKPDLFRDDTTMIATTTGELVSFLGTPAGKKTVRVKPHETTLFGRFLDEGEYGYAMGMLFLGEWTAIFLSPVTGVVYVLGLGLEYGQTLFWRAVDACVVSTSPTTPEALRSACRSLQNVYIPGTAESAIMNHLDPRSYSVLAKLYDNYLDPLFVWPGRMARLAWYAPYMYLQFYFTKASHAMPARRMCCLLRAGLATAVEEMDRMNTRLQEESELREALKQGDEMGLAEASTEDDGEDTTSSKAGKRVKAKKIKSWRKKSASLIDYGLRKEWEALRHVCTERDEGAYHYKFCFFKDIKQGTTTLGKFSGWGTRADVEIHEARKKESRRRGVNQLVEDGLDSIGLGTKTDDAPTAKVDYTKQVGRLFFVWFSPSLPRPS